MAVTIALAGNPNSGKTTMFNDLTGSNQYVGNWPGVTVEKKEGQFRKQKEITIVDLPGIYSLSPYTPEEIVSRDYLLHQEPGAILNLVDSTNIERNLYLTTQIMEIGIPVVIALNMMDILRKNGDSIDVEKLSAALGCPIIETSALKGEGSNEAVEKAVQLAKENIHPHQHLKFSPSLEAALLKVKDIIKGMAPQHQMRWYAVKLLERDAKAMDDLQLTSSQTLQIDTIAHELEKEYDDDIESIVTSQRYNAIEKVVRQAVRRKHRTLSTSDKIDHIVTNRWLALPIFAAVMFFIYYIAITTVGTYVTDFTNDVLFGEWIMPAVENWLTGLGTAQWVISLVVNGIIGGVGAVLGFVPQMIVLFLLLSFLEDCGYMSRVAFIMDRIFRKFGLSGKSFIPMLVATGCSVPGIMATKTIENEKDRRMTIITTPFMPCGAKLPIIALIAGALVGGAWWMAPLIYLIAIASVIVSGIILKKTRLFAGDPSPFVMELPQYHMPSGKNLFMHTWERVRSFIIKAGTVIFISSIIIWFLGSFGMAGGRFTLVETQDSILASIGRFIAPLFAPLGFNNWQAAVSTFSGFIAKENLVSTLGVLRGLGENAEGLGLWQATRTLFPNAAGAFSFLLFNMLCMPCFAAVGAIRRQMASTKWTLFAIGYQTLYAYILGLIVYQLGTFLFFGGPFTAGTGIALTLLAIGLFMLFRPAPKNKTNLQKNSI